MFARWYGFNELDISNMYLDELIDFCNGVMMFEGLENLRGSIPMTDQAGMMKYQQRIDKQMDTVWDMMFPQSVAKLQQKEERIAEFKKRIPSYRAIAKKKTDEMQRRGG